MDYSNVMCYGCKNFGHIRRTCPENSKSCFGCRGSGHVRRECPYLKCSVCGAQGHLGYQCFKKDEKIQPSHQNKIQYNRRENQYRNPMAGIDETDETRSTRYEAEKASYFEASSDQVMIGAIH